MKNIVLIGYMGCGKSSIGKYLAKKAKMNYLDLDDYIEQKEKLTISEIFKQKGEVYFRKIESKYLLECLQNTQNTILSLGGGTPCFGENMKIINKTTGVVSIYLQTSITELSNRLFTERAKRPLIDHLNTLEALQEFIGKHIFERLNFYTKAHLKVITDGKSIEAIVAEIENQLKDH